MKHGIVRILFSLLLLGVGAHYVWLLAHSPSSSLQLSSAKGKYYCPMHPSVMSDKPGKCPICSMNLDQMDSGSSQDNGETVVEQKERKILYYRDPMGKNRTSPVPTKDEMGMDFTPVYEDEVGEASQAEKSVEGRVAFSIPQDTQQVIGVTRATVKREELSYVIRAAGKVAYEPELYQAIEEYRIAAKTGSILKDVRGVANDGSTLNAAKTKLKLRGLSDLQIQKLAKGEIDPRTFLLPEGKAWIYAEIFEYELPLIKAGQDVEAIVPVLPSERFHGKVSSIGPVVDPVSRTVKVRAEIDDPKRLLKPDMFVNVFLDAALGNEVAVPTSAVIFTGTKTLVFVVNNTGRFVPREVLLGENSNDKYAVKDGLREGEVIVTSANFLIDSESRIRGVVERASSEEAALQPHH